MDKEEKVEEMFLSEVEKYMGGEKIVSLPVTINVEQDDLPDVERWRKHE
jgi:hypothetical protein